MAGQFQNLSDALHISQAVPWSNVIGLGEFRLCRVSRIFDGRRYNTGGTVSIMRRK